MKASDIMVSRVITVGQNTTVHEIADILLANRISAVPVLDDRGVLVGIVSESDLIHRVESGTQRHYSWWRRLVTARDVMAREFVKSHAMRAREVMSRPVITARPDMPLGGLVELLEKHRIKRVLIVEDESLVGIVSRADLLQPLAAMRRADSAAVSSDDQFLRRKTLKEVRDTLELLPPKLM